MKRNKCGTKYIYIEDDCDCPYYWTEDEDDRPCGAIEYVRADEIDRLRAENARLRNYMLMIVHATGPDFDDDAFHENAYTLAQAALRGEGDK
jgi:hypothetical protein